MTRPFPPSPCALRSTVLALLLAGAVGGCANLVPLPPGSPAPAPTAERAEYRHEVYFDTDRAEPSGAELARLDSFLAQLPQEGRPVLRVTGRADERASDIYNLDLSARRAALVGRHIEARLGRAVEVTTVGLGERAPLETGSREQARARNRSVTIAAHLYQVRLPECPDWSRDPAFDPRNLPLSNLGCANATNLGLMIADPADLARGREPGFADGVREAEALVRYRSDKVKELHDGMSR